MKSCIKRFLTISCAIFATLMVMQVSDIFVDVALAKTYKIGAVFAVTGPASFLGDPEKKTVEMIVEQVNKNGGINGVPVEIIIKDSQADATKANLAVKKLITRDKVLAVIGPSTSGNSMAVIPLAEKYKTPLVSCAASYKIVNNKQGKPYKWVFKTPQSDSMAAEAIYSHLQSKGKNRIAIMSVTSGFGASGRAELLRLADQYGMTIVADEKYGPKDTDMSVQLTKIKAHGPDAIVNWSIGPTQVTMVKNWKALGMDTIKLYQSHGFGSLKNIQLAAGDAEGIYLPLGSVNIPNLLASNHQQKTVTMNYQQNFKNKYNESLSSFGGHAWDAMHLLLNAIQKVGGDKAKIRDELEKTQNFAGQHGIFNFSASDHNGLDKSAFNMLMVKDNGWAFAD
ncbi:MAG: ABC transporter substrate-binding protein [Deltaproteobacteria bacterium]|jgi:branched-chain amino acid transport system substrate-binding protein|nr:ABC transporter substrate-binding protein [Deltaproteobacteria bacterium]